MGTKDGNCKKGRKQGNLGITMGGAMNKKNNVTPRITSDEVSRAIRSFIKSGGMIQALPEQTTPYRSMGDQHGTLENLLERTLAR